MKMTTTLSLLFLFVYLSPLAVVGCKVSDGKTSDGKKIEDAYPDLGSGGSNGDGGGGGDDGDSDSQLPIQAPHQFNLESMMTGNIRRTTECFVFKVIAKSLDGNDIRTDRDYIAQIFKTPGSVSDGRFYATADCTGSTVTEARFPTETHSLTMSYKTDIPGMTIFYASYLQVGGSPFTALQFGPLIEGYRESVASNTNCSAHTISQLDGNGNPLVASTTDSTTWVMGQLSVSGVINPLKFYDSQSNCIANGTTGLFTQVISGQNVTTLTLPAGASSTTAYVQSGGVAGRASFFVSAETLTTATNTNTVAPSQELFIDHY